MRVAAYCRVSTDKEDQANSFENQRQFFRQYIQSRADWELYDIYADEGITGTSTKKRAAFNRMIQDARLHRFELIVTREISRFARNTLDSIHYTRELRKIGIGVFFLNDNMNTLDDSSEFILTIKASQAQEESRSTSSRVKWGQTRRMEQGVVFGRSLLGYDVKNGEMTVNPEGARVVKLIFQKYVCERKGTTVIARELREAGIRTLSGRTDWQNTVILKILRNEKYCGDLKQKKTYTPDYLTHQKKYNRGEEAFVWIRNHHEPIIERALWEEAQREIARRDLDGKAGVGHGNRYPLSGKIKCGECGRSFVSRGRKKRDGTEYRVWRCGTATAMGRRHMDPAGNEVGCDVGYQIREEIGMDALRQSVNMLSMDRDAAAAELLGIVLRVLRTSQASERGNLNQQKRELDAVTEKKREVLDAYFDRRISESDMKLMNETYNRQIAELAERIEAAERRVYSEETEKTEKELGEAIRATVNGEAASDLFYGNLLDYITARPDRCLEVKLKLLPEIWIFGRTAAVNDLAVGEIQEKM